MENINIKITVKDYGTMTAELYPDKAPLTTENFTNLIRNSFFDGLIFHRVIEGFMIQGGGYDENFREKEAKSIKGEFASNGCPENDIKHTRGVLSMARTMVPDSASSQFFIMHKDAPHLDGQYAAFGRVTSGIEVVDKIASVPTDYQDCPRVPVVIEKIELI
ncbi:MAG: peptidylprolyl isomerase [Eubacteriales bacterium]